jgi:uncharacterized protein YgiM (DUF1202 family)
MPIFWKRVVVVLLALGFGGVVFSGCSILDLYKKSGLQVITNDIPSSVYLDEKLLDKTPYINKELKPGEYSLEVRPDDPKLYPYKTKVSLKSGLLTVVSWKPGPRPETSGGVIYEMEQLSDSHKSELSLTTIPDGAIVHVDGQAQGFAPILMESISKGEHEYEVKLPSYETQKHTINVLEGYKMIVTLKLAKEEYGSGEGTDATSSAALASPSATSKPSASPSPSAKTSPSPSVSPSPSPKTSLKVSPSPVASPVTVAKPKVVIKSTGFKQDGQEGLRVRSVPGAGGAEIGFAPTGSEYSYLQESQAGWYKISFAGQEGWVSGQYSQLLQ